MNETDLKNEADLAGRLASINVLLAFALATAIRDKDDPIGSLADVIKAVEEEVGDSLNGISVGLPADLKPVAVHAAQSNTLTIGRMADTFLRTMGVSDEPG